MIRAVIIGGYNTGEKTLDPIAQALCDEGLADDADVFTFPKAMSRPDDIRKAAHRQLVLTHSAGAMALDGTLPNYVVACNGVERRGVGGLLWDTGRKTASHLGRMITGPNRAAYRRVLGTNTAQMALHLPAHASRLPAVSRFSTVEALGTACTKARAFALAVVTTGDELFPNSLELPRHADIATLELPGGHDELLLRPAAMIGRIAAEIR